MALNWIKECNGLLDLIEKSEQTGIGDYSRRKLLGLVRYVAPDHIPTAIPSEPDRHQLLNLLLDLPENERFEVLEQSAHDLEPHFTRPVHRLLEALEESREESEMPVIRLENRVDKLNRYLKRIDGAILHGRYTLAMKLTNRLLKEYYRAFLVSVDNYDLKKEDLNLMSISVCRYIVNYFKKNRIPYTERRILLITTVTNVLFTTMRHINRSAGKYPIDKAIAIYARNNVNRIVRFLSRWL
ncbi:MAG: hypothetical protein KDC32_26345 [Saprospiraceae bacterium]|nr:hypothetical protein [Saprospiraceae bacterium]